MDLFKDIQGMKIRGYDIAQIAKKTGLTNHYVSDLSRLIEQGEERLLQAVEAGQIPISIAVEIAQSDDAGIQNALRQAYEKKILRGRKLMAVKRLVERRRRRGIALESKGAKRETTLTSHSLIKTYRQEADRKRLLIRKASTTRDHLIFAAHALRTLFADENFLNLLRAEGLETLPRNLASRMESGTGATQ